MSATKHDSFKLQDRDVLILHGLFECRIMTLDHISKIYFEEHREAAKKRIQKLKRAGFILVRQRSAFELNIYSISREGYQILRELKILREYASANETEREKRGSVSALTIAHELEVIDLRAAFLMSVRGNNALSLRTFSTWPKRNRFRTRSGEIVSPDAFVQFLKKRAPSGEDYFYLELDRSTENRDTLIRKILRYVDYYTSGGFAIRQGAARSDFRKFPFRILIVVKSKERRNNVIESLYAKNPSILTQVWLATFEEAVQSPLEDIWVTPLSYREGVKTSRFALCMQSLEAKYKRDSSRDLFVDQHVRKHSLFPLE